VCACIEISVGIQTKGLNTDRRTCRK